jgi:hypothetical protein
MGFHRPFAYHQQLGNLGIGFALPNQCGYLPLALRQAAVLLGDGSAG